MFVAGSALACQGPSCGDTGGSSATAGASATNNTQVNNNITPQSFNTSNATANNLTSVGVETNAEGGDAVALGVGGSSSAHASNGDQVMVLDMSNHDNTYTYRQHIQPPNLPPLAAAQMFEPYENGAWNLMDVRRMTYGPEKIGEGEVEVLFEDTFFYAKYPPVTAVTNCGVLTNMGTLQNNYYPCAGEQIGYSTLQLTEKMTTKQAELYFAHVAREKGADQVEFFQVNGRKKPTLRSSSRGFGPGGSGLMGADEQIALTAGAGFNTGESSIVKNTEPFVSVYFWRSDEQNVKVEPVPMKKGNGEVPVLKEVPKKISKASTPLPVLITGQIQ